MAGRPTTGIRLGTAYNSRGSELWVGEEEEYGREKGDGCVERKYGLTLYLHRTPRPEPEMSYTELLLATARLYFLV